MSYKSAPQASNFGVADHLGALVLVQVRAYESAVQTMHGVSPAIRCSVQVIEGGPAASQGKRFNDVLIFNKVIVQTLASEIGEVVLGRFDKGHAQAGKSPALLLVPPSEADGRIADEWITAHGDPFAALAQTPNGHQPPADGENWRVQAQQGAQAPQPPPAPQYAGPQSSTAPPPQTYTQPVRDGQPPF